MNLFFEYSGDFKAGNVLSKAGESFQVELPGGKRTKVRARDVLLQYTDMEPTHLLDKAKTIAEEIDPDFLWEVAGEDEFGFSELGFEYFGHNPLPYEAAGLLFRLHSAPMYFYKRGKGRYKAAPEANLKAALASIERKKQQAIIQVQYVDELKQGKLPDPMRPLVYQLLFKPDKNGIEYKALTTACHDLRTTPEKLMLSTGGITSPFELHRSRFLFEHFPKGTDFPVINLPVNTRDLTVANIQAFSIDDVTTTEIDDAFSVTLLDDGLVRIGIHIAAPGLAISPEDAIDMIARQRMSTVYMPGEKITMLPDELVNAYTLGAGTIRPALSLYTTLDPSNWSILSTETLIEKISVASNLRHNELDHIITPSALEGNLGNYPHKDEIALLWQWAQTLEQGRMAKRESFGLSPEPNNNHTDFNFYVANGHVTIERRRRDAPLDKIVAELMIFANCTWGKYLHDHGVPGIYRSQGRGGAAGWMQVRMLTHAAPHQGLGVDQYAWCTSPLRRYTDLVNQWQIFACVEHGVSAPLAAPFRHKDSHLLALVSSFEATYSAYSEFQTQMERYWCLRWLEQENVKHTDAVVLKDEIVRLVDIPLTLRLPGLSPMGRGSLVRLDLPRWDEADLSVEARLLSVVSDSSVIDTARPDEDVHTDTPQTPLLSDT